MSAANYCTAPDGSVLVRHLEVADTPWRRMKGLLGRDGLEPGCGLLLAGARQVHTFGMRFPIDVVFLARDGAVLHVVRAMRPWRMSRWVRGAAYALEMPAGTCSVFPGDAVTLRDR